MSSDKIQELLQECLSGYENGLTPEECLSAFPEQRHILEPLMRQALKLRFAYASPPRPEFRETMREKLLFAAGRDVSRAYAAEPEPDFVSTTRQRLINRAGADAQEALRAVPPPRLAFWVNARRRLLEAASMSAPRPVVRPMALALRTSLSAAVVVLAVAVAGLAYLTAQSNPQSVGAQLASLEEQLDEIEEQTAAGEPVPPTVLIELTRRTNQLVEKLNEEPSTPVAAALPDIIERQRDVVSAAVIDSPAAAPELLQAHAELNQVEEKVRILAARVDTPAAQPTIEGTAQASSSPTPGSATATPRPSATATPAPVLARQVRIRLVPGDTTYGLRWMEVQTSTLSFVLPSDWQVTNVVVNNAGLATLESDWLLVVGDDARVAVNTRTGEITASIDGGRAIGLRSEGQSGKIIGLQDLVEAAGELAPQLRHMLSTFDVRGELAD